MTQQTYGGMTAAQLIAACTESGAAAMVVKASTILDLLEVITELEAENAELNSPIEIDVTDDLSHMLQAQVLWDAIERIGTDIKEDTLSADGPTVYDLAFEQDHFQASCTWWHHDGPIPEEVVSGATLPEVIIAIASKIAESPNG
jgi:hypothetical protein